MTTNRNPVEQHRLAAWQQYYRQQEAWRRSPFVPPPRKRLSNRAWGLIDTGRRGGLRTVLRELRSGDVATA